MNSPQIIALGTEAHSEYIRRIAATDFTVRDARTIQDLVDLIGSDSCDVLIAEFPLPDVQGHDLMAIVSENWPECMTIFRVPPYSVSDAVRLIRLGAYSCIDEQTPD